MKSLDNTCILVPDSWEAVLTTTADGKGRYEEAKGFAQGHSVNHGGNRLRNLIFWLTGGQVFSKSQESNTESFKLEESSMIIKPNI